MKEAPDIKYKLKLEKIPKVVLLSIQAAEERAYARTSKLRYIIESVQDMLAFLSPKFIFKKNYSVGTYRIKSKSAQLAIRWAIKNNKLKIYQKDYTSLAEQLPQFIISPRYSEDIAKILLDKIKSTHPMLQKMSWSDIAQDDYLIAKIYSGYVGAGGDMEAWKHTLQPGKVALKRLKCKDGRCGTISYVRGRLKT